MTKQQETGFFQRIQEGMDQGPYTPDWESLAKHRPPVWFGQSKFGIMIHWGLYSIPAHNNEWYSRNMYIREKEEWHYHRKTYGPQDQFGYQDFIPLFQAEHFEAGEWARLIREAGARYVIPVAEHHDGFQMYRSQISKWNSWDMGPGRDLLKEWNDAAQKEGLIFGASSHRAEHWFFMGHGREFPSDVNEPMKRGDFYWPAMPEPDHQDLKSQPYPSKEFVDDWIYRTCELIDGYQPALLYFDWWIQHEAFKEGLKLVAAYYYNRAAQWGKEVSICYKHDAMMFGSGIPEVERGGMGCAAPFMWQADTAIAKNSWCYTDSLEYKTARQIICDLIRTVSKNGNLLLNVGPKGDGSIPEPDREILKEIGQWMKVNGEAIYESRPWRTWKEGPAPEPEGQFCDQEAISYTREDIWFTARGDSIYSVLLNYPEDGKIRIRSLAQSANQDRPGFHGLIRQVQVLGQKSKPAWRQDLQGLYVEGETGKPQLPVVVKVQII